MQAAHSGVLQSLEGGPATRMVSPVCCNNIHVAAFSTYRRLVGHNCHGLDLESRVPGIHDPVTDLRPVRVLP